ncbi:MAG: ABC transporter permease subunit [Phycisphaerae bacterium]
MNAALIRKTLRDYRLILTGAVGLLVGFIIVMIFASDSVLQQGDDLVPNIEWIRKLISAILGADIAQFMTPTGMASFTFTHPMTWTLIIACILTMSSGGIAGEIDRGTMDVLAALPVSRGRIYTSLTFVTAVSGIPICAAVWSGVYIATHLLGRTDVDMDALAILTAHLYAAYILLTCFSFAVSAMCSRRTTAIAIVFVFVFYSFVLNVAGAFWEPLRRIAFTGFLHYYLPLPIVRDRAWQWDNLGVLLAGAAVCWTTGLLAFRRRDIPAT